MKLYTRRVDQGQMVLVSYGYGDGVAYRRVEDQSEQPGSPDRVRWYRGDIDWAREPEGIDYEAVPCVEEWIACPEPMDADER